MTVGANAILGCTLAGLLAITACAEGERPSATGVVVGSSTTSPLQFEDEGGGEVTTTVEPPTTVPPEPPSTDSAENGRVFDEDPAPTTVPTTEPPTSEPAQEYDFTAVAPVVEAFVDERGLNGAGLIIVDRDDGVVYEEQWGEFTPDRISLIASSSKMITAGVLLRLHDDGLLDIDAPIADVVEWGIANPDITAAQLLSNSSGLVGLGPEPGYAPYLCQFLAAGTLQACAETIFTTPDDDADLVASDTEFRYGGAQWQIAGAVAEAASGTSWDELIEEIYVEPCGLDALGYNNHFAQIPGGFEYPVDFAGDPATLIDTANPNMEGGAYASPSDYAKLLLMQLRGGTCGDSQVLSQDALDRMHGDRVGAVYGDAAPGTGYGMGWWVDRESGRLTDPGAYGSVPWLDLEEGYGAYLVIEANSVTGLELATQLYDIVETAVTAG
ncbi:MAG: beta-lactamase family protein [Ilumatobacter sp.]|nr:beta-lactamase family protein [Ilumatobacter sp.]